MPPKAKTTRTNKNEKLADRVTAIITMVEAGKPKSAIVPKLESIRDRLAKSKKDKEGGVKKLSAYQQFVKKNFDNKELAGLPAPERMKKLGAMWRKSQA